MSSGYKLRTQTLPPSFWCGPTEQLQRGFGLFPLIQVNPHAIEIIKIAPQSEAGTGPLECLGFGAGAGIVIIGPLLACGRVRAHTEDPQLASHEYFCDRLLVSTPLEVVAGMDGILPGPAGGSEKRIEAIRICPRVGIGNNLPTEFSRLCGVRHPPFDHRPIKGYFELCYEFFDLIE